MSLGSEKIFLRDARATQALGANIAKYYLSLIDSSDASVNEPMIIFLNGDLGAGKTTLTQGLAKALGIEERVKSPTYTLVESYQGEAELRHFDLYRMSDPEELFYLGLEDMLARSSLLLFEWPERGAGVLPKPAMTIDLALAKNLVEAEQTESFELKLPQGRTASIHLDTGIIERLFPHSKQAGVKHFWFSSMANQTLF